MRTPVDHHNRRHDTEETTPSDKANGGLAPEESKRGAAGKDDPRKQTASSDDAPKNTAKQGTATKDAPKDVPSEDAIGRTELPRKSLVLVSVIAVVILVAALLIGVIPRVIRNHKLESEAENRKDALPKVSFIVAHEAGKISKLELPGTLEPLRDTSVFARVSGYVKAWHVDIGDNVTENQLLVELETPELDQQLKQVQAALLQAKSVTGVRQADLDLARRTLDRYDKAKSDGVPGAISERDLDTQRSAVASATASLAAAEADVEAARADVSRLHEQKGFARVLAQFSGRITTRNVEIGQLVTEGTGASLFHLVQANPLRAFVNIPQRFAPMVHVGQTAEVHVREFPERGFPGTVARAAESIDQTTRTMRVEILVKNDDGALIPGMYGEARLALESPQPAMQIPSTALLVSSSGTRLAVVEKDDTIAYRTVAVGRDNGDALEIVSGLEEGTRVVTNLANEIEEGTKVEAIEVKKKTGDQQKTKGDDPTAQKDEKLREEQGGDASAGTTDKKTPAVGAGGNDESDRR